jgi:hypothetical protein
LKPVADSLSGYWEVGQRTPCNLHQFHKMPCSESKN